MWFATIKTLIEINLHDLRIEFNRIAKQSIKPLFITIFVKPLSMTNHSVEYSECLFIPDVFSDEFCTGNC